MVLRRGGKGAPSRRNRESLEGGRCFAPSPLSDHLLIFAHLKKRIEVMSISMETNQASTDSEVTPSGLLSTTSSQPQSANQASNDKDAINQQQQQQQQPLDSQEDLWSSILNSVKSERAIPSRNLIVLGQSLLPQSPLSLPPSTQSEDVC